MGARVQGAAAGPDAKTNRLFGTDRFQTAVAIVDHLDALDAHR